MSAPEFKIRTIADIRAIPIEKRDAFLTDLKYWLEFLDDNEKIVAEIATDLGLPSNSIIMDDDRECMTWIDDGEHKTFIVLHPAESKQP
ncbi:MAG TPA: hypothetical protein VN702_17850 [Acetobacteraceae bacterium]|nr:hypothetical protein [Acetobacteraceae bacterium]